MNKLKQILSDLRASLWFMPGVMIIFSIGLALVLIEVDSQIKAEYFADYPRLFGLGADGSRGMLTAIASSMLTVAALAFTLTLSAVSQASAQFTPRIFRNFMRDRANQFVLGYFVSVFVFCLLVLRTIRGVDELKFVPSFAVLTGLALAVGGVLVLIFFIHHIADSLQIGTILENITDETKQAVEKMFPQELGDAASENEKAASREVEAVKDWKKIPARKAGYVQDVDLEGLLEYAARHDILIKCGAASGSLRAPARLLRKLRGTWKIQTEKRRWAMKIKSKKSMDFSLSNAIAQSNRTPVSASAKSWTSRSKLSRPASTTQRPPSNA